VGPEHRSALFYSPVAHGRLTEKGLNALIDSFSSSVPAQQQIRSIYSNTSYIYPSDLGGLSPEYWEAMRLETDGVPGLGACGARWVAKMLSEQGGPTLPVFSYLFARPTTTPPLSDGVTVPHASEVPYVFGNTSGLPQGADRPLALIMSEYWSSFAISGVPGGGTTSLQPWPR